MTSFQKNKIALLKETLFRNPRYYLTILGLIAGTFLILGFLFKIFFSSDPQPIPLIQGCQGPIRIRPSASLSPHPQHHIYMDLSTRQAVSKPSKAAESLLPPPEQPLFDEQKNESQNLHSDIKESTEPTRTPPKMKKKTSTSLDDLLIQIDEVMAKAPPPPKKR